MKMNYTSLNLIFLLWIGVLCLNFAMYESKFKYGILCTPCHGKSCDTRLGNCKYGHVKDECNRYVCAKGPGEDCRSYFGLQGVCADGLFCSQNKCIGCVDIKGEPALCFSP